MTANASFTDCCVFREESGKLIALTTGSVIFDRDENAKIVLWFEEIYQVNSTTGAQDEEENCGPQLKK